MSDGEASGRLPSLDDVLKMDKADLDQAFAVCMRTDPVFADVWFAAAENNALTDRDRFVALAVAMASEAASYRRVALEALEKAVTPIYVLNARDDE